MNTGRLDKPGELSGSDEARRAFNPARKKSNELENKEKLNKSLFQVQNDLKKIEIRLDKLGKVGKDESLKEAIKLYLHYEDKLDTLYQKIKYIKAIIEKAKTDNYSLESDLERNKAKEEDLNKELRKKEQNINIVQKLKERIKILKNKNNEQQKPWSAKLDHLGSALAELEQIISETSKLSDSQNRNDKVMSGSAKENFNLNQGDHSQVLQSLNAKLEHLRKVNSYIYTSKQNRKISQAARFSNSREDNQRRHLSSTHLLVDEITKGVSSQESGADPLVNLGQERYDKLSLANLPPIIERHASNPLDSFVVVQGQGSGLDREDDPNSHRSMKLDQSSDSVESPDQSNPPQQTHYQIKIDSEEAFNTEIKHLEELEGGLRDIDNEIRKQKKYLNKPVDLKSEEFQKQMFQDMLDQLSNGAKKILENSGREKQVRIYEHIGKNPNLSREEAWEYLAYPNRTDRVIPGNIAVETFVAGSEFYMKNYLIDKYKYLNEDMLKSIGNCIPKEYKEYGPIYEYLHYELVKGEIYTEKISDKIRILIESVEDRYRAGKVMLRSLSDKLDVLKESRERYKEKLVEEHKRVLQAAEKYRSAIYEHLCEKVKSSIDQQSAKLWPHFDACTEVVQTIKKALEQSKREYKALEKKKDEYKGIININTDTLQEQEKAYKQMEKDREKKLKDIGEKHNRFINESVVLALLRKNDQLEREKKELNNKNDTIVQKLKALEEDKPPAEESLSYTDQLTKGAIDSLQARQSDL